MSKQAAELVALEHWHIAALLTDLRRADRVELEAIRGWTAEQELKHAIGSTKFARTCLYEGKVLAIFGDTKHDATYGLPWMVTSTWVETHARPFIAVCRGALAEARARHVQLINFVEIHNLLAIRWLKWLGFEFAAPIPYGINGELFYPFQMEGTLCAQ